MRARCSTASVCVKTRTKLQPTVQYSSPEVHITSDIVLQNPFLLRNPFLQSQIKVDTGVELTRVKSSHVLLRVRFSDSSMTRLEPHYLNQLELDLARVKTA